MTLKVKCCSCIGPNAWLLRTWRYCRDKDNKNLFDVLQFEGQIVQVYYSASGLMMGT